MRTFYFFVQWLKMFGNLFFIWGIKGYAEDCTTDVVFARKILLSQELQNMESSSIVCVVDNSAREEL